MDLEETKALIRTLRECGITRYKSTDLELDLGPEPVRLDAPIQPDPVAIHKIQEMTSLLKLDDVSLVDRLFPDQFKEEEEAEDTANQEP